MNDFRDFFGLKRHETFEDISKNPDIINALRDLYDHPDKVELYPGIFCESDKDMSDDPGPSEVDSALWAAIPADAICLVLSDRFYTVVSKPETALFVSSHDLGLEHQFFDVVGHEPSLC